jgi:hypothetical protein
MMCNECNYYHITQFETFVGGEHGGCNWRHYEDNEDNEDNEAANRWRSPSINGVSMVIMIIYYCYCNCLKNKKTTKNKKRVVKAVVVLDQENKKNKLIFFILNIHVLSKLSLQSLLYHSL